MLNRGMEAKLKVCLFQVAISQSQHWKLNVGVEIKTEIGTDIQNLESHSLM